MDGRRTGRSKPRGGPSAPGLLLMVEHWCLCSPLLGPRSRAPGHDREMDAIARPPDKLRPHHTESRGPSRAPRMPHVTLANNNNNNITAVSIHIMHGWRPYMYTPIYTTNSTYNTPVHNNPALALCATHRGNCRREYGVNNVYPRPRCVFTLYSTLFCDREYGVNTSPCSRLQFLAETFCDGY